MTQLSISPRFQSGFWQACFEALPLPICIFDHEGIICAINHAWHAGEQIAGSYFAKLCIGAQLFSEIAAQQTELAVTEEMPAQFLQQFQPAIQILHSKSQMQTNFEFLDVSARKLRWFRAHLNTIPNSDSSPLLLLSLEDITQIKLDIETSQTANLVYRYSQQAIMVTDAKNRIIAINPAYTQLTGYTPEDVLGKNPRFASSGRHSSDFYQLMWHAIHTNGLWQGEMWNLKKDGSEIIEWLTINAISDEKGKIMRYMAIFSDITSQKQQQEIQWKQANFDALTELPNRRLMLDRLETELRKAHRSARRVAVMFIDLDHFKQVNDQFGHAMGDVLLIESARRLSSCVRDSDTVARIGGDEFILVLGDLPDTSEIKRIARAVLNALGQDFQLSPELSVKVSGSIGIAIYPQDAEKSLQLIEYADQAMYRAKRGGKNQFHFFAPD